ncbi:MAG: MFS transporter [Candidatus Thermoplasmatota archaeon]|nr:MFS transporter [Candidatus Thermoplasmatota archaeon]
MKFRFKLFYFLQYFSVGVIAPYLVVFLNQKDFTGGQIGMILGVLPIAGLVFQPVWSFFSDIFNKRRLLLLIALFGLILASLGLGFSKSFFAVFLWAILFSAMRAPISPIISAIVLDYLEEQNEVDSFSMLRLWGSVGFGIATLIMGGLFLDRILEFFPWFTTSVFLSMAILSQLLPERGRPYAYTGLKKDIHAIMRNPNFTFYLLGSLFIGATFGIYHNYLTLFLQTLEASSWLVGAITSIQAFVEIPVMIALPYLLKKFSRRQVILIGALILPVRWLLYFFIRQPGWILPIQLVHGLPVVSFFVVSVAFVDRLVNPKFRATGQALYSTAVMGVGSGLGVFLAGRVIDCYGVRQIWIVNVVLGLVGVVILAIIFHQVRPEQE